MSDRNQHIAAIAARHPVPRGLWWCGLVLALAMAAQSIGVALMGSGLSQPRGVLGINALADCRADRFCPVTSVKPGLPAARAGIVAGDQVRPDRYWERHRTLPPGEAVGLTDRQAGRERHVTLVTLARPFFAPTWIITGVASTAVCLVALLILARAGRRWWSFLLGCALIGIGVPGGYPRFWQNDTALFPFFFAALAILYMAGPVLMMAALRGFRRETTGSAPRWLSQLLWLVSIGTFLATIWGTAVELDSAPILGLSNGLLLTSSLWSLGWLLAPIALAGGWKGTDTVSRTRYRFMWVAVTVMAIHPIVDPVIQATGNNYNDVSWPVAVQLVSLTLGAALFAYAILRHRVVDLGFVINRTLVYSAFSFVTLAAFGLVEWVSNKLLPIEGRETSAAIEAIVALGLFLLFHHIHHRVEHLVERLFFRRWHANEADLRRFLHRATFITQSDALLENARSELQRFGAGAEVAIYRETTAGYSLVAGNSRVLTELDENVPVIVGLRADHIPSRNNFTTGDLALPMTHRSDLMGFVLLGPKPTGDPYRPDEEALLAEAVIRIGQDLYSLRVEDLERANTELLRRLELVEAASTAPMPERKRRWPDSSHRPAQASGAKTADGNAAKDSD